MLTIEIDFSSERPVYRQIAEQLRGLIARGDLGPGAELPSVREIADSAQVNLNTVAKAYRVLADEGWIDLRHGSRARVLRGEAARALDLDELARRVHDVASYLVLHGSSRSEVERFFEKSLKRFFEHKER
ncbi:MAG: GntR family transcriptional regulator [Polyangiaceae bacterium]